VLHERQLFNTWGFQHIAVLIVAKILRAKNNTESQYEKDQLRETAAVLTGWSHISKSSHLRVPVKKPTYAELVKKRLAFYKTQSSLYVSQESAMYSYSEPPKSNPCSHIWILNVFNISPHLHLSVWSDVFPSGFPTKILYAFPFSPMPAIWLIPLVHLDLVNLITFSMV
jgi:hypothetical protein